MSAYISDDIKAVLFDHDDTLVSTFGPKSAQHKYIAKTYYGKDLTDAEIRQHWGKPLEKLLCALFSTEDGKQALAYTLAHHQDYPKKLLAGTLPALRYLKAKGKLVGVITATNRYSFDNDILLHKVPRKLIDYTLTADETPYHKPDPKVFTPAIKWLTDRHIKPAETLYIGDSLLDMQAARGAGFSFIGVETGLTSNEDFMKAGANSVPTLADLMSY
ncbi:MAG TPA: HAD-IA family hydrolase [Candidatus Limnocylindrales bacterium]|nr:HAD-IA family hydrolase [Candidatus Limnocylindrales bacterium]